MRKRTRRGTPGEQSMDAGQPNAESGGAAERSSEAAGAGPDRSRRRFLTASGIGAAGVAVGGLTAAGFAARGATPEETDAAYGFTPLKKRDEPGFDHVVVIMFENRSFDHILGRLYADGQVPTGQSFEGLAAGYSNTAFDGTEVAAHVYSGSTDEIMCQPDPDPGEFYSHVNTQLYDVIEPESNAHPDQTGLASPYNAPAAGQKPTMTGFVRDYIVNFRGERDREPTEAEYSRVMGGFVPEMLPVVSALARSFGVYDHWHAAVPSQTFCNRSFFHASTSHGFVTNQQGPGFSKWLDADAVPTIFNRLEDAGIPWRVYYDAEQTVSLTGLLHAPSIEKYWLANFRSMEQFHADAANGDLPAYSFIEPRMVFDHNDMHPPLSSPKIVREDGKPVYDSALSDMRAGEALLADVYASVKGGASTSGSNAMNTALVVTFDEHGGLYDHVPPPSAEPPEPDDGAGTIAGVGGAGEMGFTFDRLGCRVPAIIVSAYTAPGTVINDEMHHSAITKTLCELHGLDPLTDRDRNARPIFNAVNLTTPRQPALWPTITAQYVPPNPESTKSGKPASTDAAGRSRPLTPPALGLLGILLAKYEPDATLPQNFGDAYDVLEKHGQGLFGVRD